MNPPARPRDPAGQELSRRFAAVQGHATRVALVFVVGAYALYVSGAVPARVPVAELPGMVGEGLAVFLQVSGLPTGWDWIGEIGHGDLMTLAALLGLVGVVALAYLALLPLLVRRRDWVYAGIVAAQLIVFALAASGWVSGGH